MCVIRNYFFHAKFEFVTDYDVAVGPCSSNPCYGDSTCEEHDGTFTCFCTSDRTGDRCERALTSSDISVPQFADSTASVELTELENVEHKFSLEVEFKARASDGVIMFAQQYSDGSGDFISLCLVQNHLEFRYNLGDGVVVMRTAKKIKLGTWHRAQAKRWHKDGMLKLDGHDNIDGQSPGSQRSLDVLQTTSVGNLFPEDAQNELILENLGLASSKDASFRGCIRKFKLGYREVKIQSPSDPMVLSRIGLTECAVDPSSAPKGCRPSCLNGGTCSLNDRNEFHCRCPVGWEGAACEAEAAVEDFEAENDACSSSPCEAGGRCVLIEGGSDFVCQCPMGRRGSRCQEQGL